MKEIINSIKDEGDTSIVKAPVSQLRQEINERKARKQRNKMNQLRKTTNNKPAPAHWSEAHSLVSTLHEMLTEYGHIGLLGNNAAAAIPADKTAEFNKNIKLLFTDVTSLSNKLAALRTRLKAGDSVVDEDDIADFMDIYMELDALRIDITTILTPTAAFLTETVNDLNNVLQEETKHVA